MFGGSGPTIAEGGTCRRLRDVTDGTSNTIAIGERAWEVNGVDYRAGTMWGHKGSTDAQNAEDSGMVSLFACGWRSMNAPRVGTNPTHRRGFASAHDGGVQYLLADGSVRFISENISHNGTGTKPVDTTFAKLLAVDDGQPIGEF